MKKILTLILLLNFYFYLHAQNCCQALDESFSLACLDNLVPCNADIAPCDDASFDAIFYSANWAFFNCSPCNSTGCDTYQDYTVLPIELIKFKTSHTNDGILVSWTTIEEVNNYGFYVEISANGEHWDEVDFIEASTSYFDEKNYSYLVKNPFKGTNYIRLRQIDFDGKTNLLPTRVLVWQGGVQDLQLVVLPNPSTDYIVPVLPTEFKNFNHVDYKIYSIYGSLIAYFPNSPLSNTKLDISGLQKGSYILSCSKNGLIKNTVFVKN